jgi:hypothetical protein
VHPPRLAEKDAALGRDRCETIQQMFERRTAGPPWVATLERLRELHLVADQDHIPGAHTHRDRVGERDLARLVDKQVIDLLIQFLSCEQPSGSGDQIVSAVGRFAVVGGVLNDRAV